MTVLGFSAPGLRPALEIPVEVRGGDGTLVARSTVGRSVVVEPGTYFVGAVLPAGQQLSAAVAADGDYVMAELAPQHAASPGGGGMAVRDLLLGAEAPVVPERVRLRLLAGNLLRGELDVVQDREALADHEAVIDYRPPGGGRPLYAELLQPDHRSRTRAVPVAPRQARACELRFFRKPDRSWSVDVHLQHSGADLLCRYRDGGRVEQAATVAGTLEGSEQMLLRKLRDPVAAAVGAYSLLRFASLDRLHDWTGNLRAWFAWLPDGSAIHGEHLAREGEHRLALDAFLELEERGLPLFSDGLAFAIARLELYGSIGAPTFDRLTLRRAAALVAALRVFARSTDFGHPLLAFAGDPQALAAAAASALAGPPRTA